MGRLSDGDLAYFGESGYLIVRDVVPEDLLQAPDDEIDQLIGTVSPDEGSGGPGANLWFRPRAELPFADREPSTWPTSSWPPLTSTMRSTTFK
jgi:hypothetical protein